MEGTGRGIADLPLANGLFFNRGQGYLSGSWALISPLSFLLSGRVLNYTSDGLMNDVEIATRRTLTLLI